MALITDEINTYFTPQQIITGILENKNDLTVEALNVENAFNAVMTFFNSNSSLLTNLFNMLFKFEYNISLINTSSFLEGVSKLQYTSIAPMELLVPEGFNGNLKDYVKELESAVSYSTNGINTLLPQYEKLIGNIINNTDDIKNTDLDRSKYNNIEKDIMNYHSKLGSYFLTNSTVVKQKYSKVISSNKEWSEIIKSLKLIVEEVNNNKIQKLKDRVEKISTSIEILKNNDNKPNVESNYAIKVSDNAYLCARVIELYSVCIYKTLSIVQSTNTNVENINSTFKF